MTVPGIIELQDRPVPVPGPGEVLIQIHTVTLCGSDIHYYAHGRIADFVVRDPIILGHEASGVVARTGDGVDPSRLGQKVALEPGAACGTCTQCLGGRYNLCPSMAFFATPPYDGALQEWVVLPAYLAHPVPERLTHNEVALIEPLAVAVQACRRASITGGERVLVAGAGAIGLLCAQVASAFGAAEVILSDTDPARVRTARERFGLDARAPQDISGQFSRFIECSGADRALVAGIKLLRPGSLVVAVGMGQQEMSSIPLGWMLVNEIALLTTFRYANAYPAAIRLAASGNIKLEELIGTTYPFPLTETAFTHAQEDKSILRSAIQVAPAEETPCAD